MHLFSVPNEKHNHLALLSVYLVHRHNRKQIKISAAAHTITGKYSIPPHVLLTNEDRALLAKVSSLLEEIVETMQVQEDEEAMQAIKQADKDVRTKKTRD